MLATNIMSVGDSLKKNITFTNILCYLQMQWHTVRGVLVYGLMTGYGLKGVTKGCSGRLRLDKVGYGWLRLAMVSPH